MKMEWGPVANLQPRSHTLGAGTWWRRAYRTDAQSNLFLPVVEREPSVGCQLPVLKSFSCAKARVVVLAQFGRLCICNTVKGIYATLIFGDKCGQSEYLSTAGECCPMCNIGLVVYKDCTGHSSTTCKPCSRGTYMNEPNGLYKCFQCKTCDNGLYGLRECTSMQDAVCDIQDGYYCGVPSDRECSYAVKHKKCVPGQQIKTPGTRTSDTVCENCLPGYYSPDGVNCSKWTDCLDKLEILDQEGSSIKDVQCKPAQRNRYYLITPFLFVPVSWAILFGLSKRFCHSSDLKTPVEETECQIGPTVPPVKSHLMPEENHEDDVTAVTCSKGGAHF